MRVCMATTGFPRWPGDGECSFIWEAARHIASKGVDVCVVAMHSPGAKTREYMSNVEVLRPKYMWPEKWEGLRREGAAGIPATWRKHPLIRVQILPFVFFHSLTITKVAYRCDIIHAHWTLSAANACLGKRLHQKPILVTLQGSDIFQVPKQPIGAWLTRRILSCVDSITALSRALVRAVSELGFSPSNISVIPNGVNTKEFFPISPNDRENIVLYVGSLIERKGVKYLISAMRDVFRRFPEFRLIVVGNGPERLELSKLADDMGIGEKVIFIGFQSHKEVRRWMQHARLLALPSLEEAQGVVLLEAMACGTPVVASCVGGIPDVITPDVGMLVPPANAEAISSAIQNILGNPDLWYFMSQMARKRAVNYYDWNIIADQYIEIYKKLV